ncbi:zf-HC2 domain-containing protein [Myxococcus xanthus]|uniref:Zf-HC2 domain-containing protein n=1 Tax=Myxococcus xanthus TaxID=34 RepID=A0A7Y4MTI8_MYXXA|nr:zf-HC2 domain-containing protein [Myxococcus xanthus]NOJ81674.1 zf-HC2 domain-containing protein [Myxococcus xanthus]NOJ89650.1 zf-HC2 domain-containing protein [Myxococcus xanthus]
MAACPDQEERLDLHAAGALEDDEALGLIQHLEGCEGCRQALATSKELLALVALPALSPEEKTELQELPRRTLSEWRRGARRQGLGLKTLGALMATVAAVTLLLLVPGAWLLPGPGAKAPVTAAAPTTDVEELDAETMAAIEAWAGLEPLDAVLFEDSQGWDEELDIDVGETL